MNIMNIQLMAETDIVNERAAMTGVIICMVSWFWNLKETEHQPGGLSLTE